jgi:hypothetical protein
VAARSRSSDRAGQIEAAAGQDDHELLTTEAAEGVLAAQLLVPGEANAHSAPQSHLGRTKPAG